MLRLSALLLILASASGVIPEYLHMGFTHIVPEGLDHVLFVLGLFFLTRNFGCLMLQMTLFTIAHSLTLGLSLYGVISLPTRAVEVAIALSIAFIAIENLFSDRLSRWRPAVVFGFGLIHGLGFAHTFVAKSVAPGDFLAALYSFNLGIEFGQLAVVGIAYAVVSVFWNRNWYRSRIARPASAMIAASGIYWVVERSI